MTVTDHTYRIQGNRTGILLIHGLCGTPTEMRHVANGLGRAGYTVLCPQLSGHCGSEADLQASTWQDGLVSCEASLDELRQTCDTVIVGGLSTGALLSLALAAKHPGKVDGLALLAPVISLNGGLIPWCARLVRTVFSKTIANMIKFPDLHPHGIKAARIRDFVGSADAVRRAVPGITQPVLIVHPREDDDAHLNNALYLQHNLPGTVEMVVLDDSCHNVTGDRQRDVVVERTANFVDRVARKICTPCKKPAPPYAPAKTAPARRPAALYPAAA